MLMLLCAVATWAGPTDLPQITTDLENPIYYTISNTRSDGKVIYYTAEGVKDENPQVLTDAHKFFFTGASLSDVKIHNAEAEKSGLLFTGDGAWNETGVSCEICVTPYGDGTTGLAIKFSGTSLNEQNQGRNGYTTWSANDAGSVYVMDLVEDINWPEAEKFYTIEAPLFENVQGVKKGLQVDANGSLGWNTIDLTNKNCYWTVEYNSENDGYAVKNLGTGTYLNGTAMSGEFANYAKFNYLSQCQFNIVVNGTTVHANNHNGGANPNGNIVSWGGAVGSASAWQFVEQQDPDAVKEIEITYNFTYNGQPLDGYTQTVNTVTGAEYPNITVAFPFGVSVTKPEGTIAAEDAPAKTITIAVEENLPFVYAASYDAVANWYYVKNKGEFYLSHVEELDHIALGNDQKTVDTSKKDAFTWAFVGNPFDGFQLVNKAAGKGKVLSSSTTIDGDGANTFPVMTVSPVNEGNNELWVLTASGHQENGFFIAQKGFVSNRMNNRGNKLAYWTTGADNGSTFTVELRNDDEELLAALAEAQELVNSITGVGVGYATSASIKAVQDAIDAKDLVALQNAVAALETIQPKEGVLYTVKNAYSGVYMNLNDIATAAVWNGGAALNEVFSFVPATNEGEFYMYNVKRGRYLSNNPAHGHGHVVFAADNTNGAVVVTIKNLGAENRVSITPAGGATIHHDAGQGVVVGWNGNKDSRSAWVVEEVANPAESVHTLTVGEAGYATLYLACDVVIPETVKAYVATEFDEEGNLELTQITGILPANTAVIVEAAAESYTFAYSAEKGTAVTNLLEGTTVKTNIEETAYVLGNTDGIGMYLAKKNQNEGAAWLNNAFKAYLPASAVPTSAQGVKSFSFRFGEGTTGIENVESAEAVKAIFDLTGRRVEAVTAPGIYIVNGKKVLVK